MESRRARARAIHTINVHMHHGHIVYLSSSCCSNWLDMLPTNIENQTRKRLQFQVMALEALTSYCRSKASQENQCSNARYSKFYTTQVSHQHRARQPCICLYYNKDRIVLVNRKWNRLQCNPFNSGNLF